MKVKNAAGMLMFKRAGSEIKVFLVKPGGPYWVNKDAGAWSIPKGEINGNDTPFDTALREFREETGFIALYPFHWLGTITQKSGKVVHAWAFEKDVGNDVMTSNTIEIEWPKNSGIMIEIPEVGEGGYFNFAEARVKMNPAQTAFLDRLMRLPEVNRPPQYDA